MANTTKNEFKIDDLFIGKNAIDIILDFAKDNKNNKLESVPIVGTIVGRLLEIYPLQEVQVFLNMLNKKYDKSFRVVYDPSTNETTFYYSNHPVFDIESVIKLIVKNIYNYFGLKSNPLDGSDVIDKYLSKEIKEFDIKNIGLYDTVKDVLDLDFFYQYNNLKILYNIEEEPKVIPFDQPYKCVINKIELLTQFVEKIDPRIKYRLLYRFSRDLGEYTLALRNALIENIKSKMDK